MTPTSLLLEGFIGIRDGLRRRRIALNLDALAGAAKMVALIAPNGGAKSTILDNLTPYLAMPSRVSGKLSGFNYYDEVFLPVNRKELEWRSAEGRVYRTELVIRLGKRRSMEAYLYEHHGAGWAPVVLEDGTRSDGKCATYERCVETILGPASTFFTTAFAAQARRHLSSYENGEAKELLIDLLDRGDLRALGRKAADVARLLRAGLGTLREARQTLAQELEQVSKLAQHAAAAQERIATASACRHSLQQTALAAQTALATLHAQQKVAAEREPQRRALLSEREALAARTRQALGDLQVQEARERDRLQRLEQRIAHSGRQTAVRRQAIANQLRAAQATVDSGAAVARAQRRLRLGQRVLQLREQYVADARTREERLRETMVALNLVSENVGAAEREAGQLSLRVEELRLRSGLIQAVPCNAHPMRRDCQLLADAHAAAPLLPDVQAKLRTLANQRGLLQARQKMLHAKRDALSDAPAALARAEARLARSRIRNSILMQFAARRGELAQARATLEQLAPELAELACTPCETEQELGERFDINSALATLAARRDQIIAEDRMSAARFTHALAAMPAVPEACRIGAAERALRASELALAENDKALSKARSDLQSAVDAGVRHAELARRLNAHDERLSGIEQQLTAWNLCAKCLGPDGLIALLIDDAGPALAGLANELLAACYGSRFTLAIQTLVAKACGDAREGFQIMVYDTESESSEPKPVTRMSGGEKIWINDALTRALALYLARGGTQRHRTLFSDETDGALDMDRKRMFMDMKRRVLDIGDYEREYFISHTPELAAMADAVIDLTKFRNTTEDVAELNGQMEIA